MRLAPSQWARRRVLLLLPSSGQLFQLRFQWRLDNIARDGMVRTCVHLLSFDGMQSGCIMCCGFPRLGINIPSGAHVRTRDITSFAVAFGPISVKRGRVVRTYLRDVNAPKTSTHMNGDHSRRLRVQCDEYGHTILGVWPYWSYVPFLRAWPRVGSERTYIPGEG